MATFREYPGALERVLAGERMQQVLRRRVERAKEFAERISPVDTGRYRYGRFVLNARTDPTGERRHRAGGEFEPLGDGVRGGFHIEVGTRVPRSGGAPVAYALLYNPTPYARYLEWGTRHMRAQRILGRSVDALR